jgi:Fe-S-cluster containining protein
MAGLKATQPWYRDGLRFECTQCGACCGGEPGFVWVDAAEAAALANELGIGIEVFRRDYVRQIGRDQSLIERPNGDCILLDPQTRKCTVYRARPTQCRTWPFWDSTVTKRADWQHTCEVCPGAGTGKLYTLAEIETARQRKAV